MEQSVEKTAGDGGGGGGGVGLKTIEVGYFHISAQNIDCGYSLEPPRRGGSNGYLQSMFLSRNKKNNVYPCKSPWGS